MYLRREHIETSLPALREFVRANPLGILFTALASRRDAHPRLQCSHIPWLLDHADDQELGRLRGHMARANPQARVLAEHARRLADSKEPVILEDEVLVLFNATVDHYVPAGFHSASKAATGRVVPTWNYAAVQAYGRARVYADPQAPATRSFLHRQITDLSQFAESELMGYAEPWRVTDAPPEYIQGLSRAIIGIEIELTRLEGKWKMSQEETPEDRAGIVAGFAALGTARGDWMATTIQERANLRARATDDDEATEA